MTYINGFKPVPLPGEVLPTTVDQVGCQPKDAFVADAHPYLNAFLEGVQEGFIGVIQLPFAVLFGLGGCSSHGSPLIDTKTVVNADCSAADGGSHADGSADASSPADADVYSDDASSDAGEAGPTQTDAELDAGSDAPVDAAEDMAQDATVTQDAAEDISAPDAAVDMAQDATAADGAELPPDDASVDDAAGVDTADTQDAAVQDAAGDASIDAEAQVCQYFCDAGISADIPGDVTATDAGLPEDAAPTGVISNLCGPIAAPANSVAVACSNSTINTMLQGVAGCVAECGFFDNNIGVSTDPKNPVPFALALFAPPADPKQTITLTLKSPILSDGSATLFPGFMGSSFTFVFDQKKYDTIGDIQWNAEDKDVDGKLKGSVQITYMPFDFFFQLPPALDITYSDQSGNKMGYRTPCDQLSNPQVQCTEVK